MYNPPSPYYCLIIDPKEAYQLPRPEFLEVAVNKRPNAFAGISYPVLLEQYVQATSLLQGLFKTLDRLKAVIYQFEHEDGTVWKELRFKGNIHGMTAVEVIVRFLKTYEEFVFNRAGLLLYACSHEVFRAEGTFGEIKSTLWLRIVQKLPDVNVWSTDNLFLEKDVDGLYKIGETWEEKYFPPLTAWPRCV